MIIYFRAKRSPTGKLLLRRWIPMRRVDKHARLDNKFKNYRRKWWWDEYRYNLRHNIL